MVVKSISTSCLVIPHPNTFDGYLSLVVNISNISGHFKFHSQLSFRALGIWLHDHVIIDIVEIWVLFILTLANLFKSLSNRYLLEIVIITRIGCHVHLDPNFLVSAKIIWFHHSFVVMAILRHVLEWFVLRVNFTGWVVEQLGILDPSSEESILSNIMSGMESLIRIRSRRKIASLIVLSTHIYLKMYLLKIFK